MNIDRLYCYHFQIFFTLKLKKAWSDSIFQLTSKLKNSSAIEKKRFLLRKREKKRKYIYVVTGLAASILKCLELRKKTDGYSLML